MPAVTRAAASAAAQQQQQWAEASQGVDLDLALATAGHLLDQRDVCALLCTSKATAASVARTSSGRVAVKLLELDTLQQAQVLARWLGKHSSLPRRLEVELEFGEDEVADKAAASTALCAVLPRLTGLQSLSYMFRPPGAPSPNAAALAAAIQPLTRLTELFVSGMMADVEDMQLFPVSLQEVTVDFRGWFEDPRQMLQLGHLTAVTELDLGACREDELFAGPDGDVLPPNLVRLRGSFSGPEVLKGLASLRHLDGPYSRARLEEIVDVGLAAQLTAVWFASCLGAFEVDEEGVQMLLPINELDASFGLAAEVQWLLEADLASVVRSVTLIGGVVEGVEPELNAAVIAELRRLPSLQGLRVDWMEVEELDWLGLTQLTFLGLARARFDRLLPIEFLVLPVMLAQMTNLREVSLPAAVHASFAFDESAPDLSHITCIMLA